MKKDYHYRVTSKVQNGLGVLARMTILLRKFNVNIQSLDVEPLDDEKRFYDIHITIDTVKDETHIIPVMKKLERLVPVVNVRYEKINNGS